MLVNRDELETHLRRLYAGGQIKDAVFYDAFACKALSLDAQLLVIVPPLRNVEPLPEPVGFTDVELFYRNLRRMRGDLPKVAVDFVEGRVVLEQEHGGKVELSTASPNLIASYVKDEMVEKILSLFRPDSPETSLSKAVVRMVLTLVGLLAPAHIFIEVGREGGRIVVGDETEPHRPMIDLPVKTAEGEEPYELIFSAKIMRDVFRELRDPTQTKIVLTGPDSVIQVSDGPYRYVISPQEPA